MKINIGRLREGGGEAGNIVRTRENGGRQWVRASVQGFDSFGKIMDVAFAETSTGWAAGADAFFGGSRGVLSHSSDGGKSWRKQLEISNFTINGLEAIDPLNAFAVGAYDLVGGGVVLRTTNGGSFWQDVTPAADGFRDVFFLDATTGWIVGSASTRRPMVARAGINSSEIAEPNFPRFLFRRSGGLTPPSRESS